MIAPAQRLRLGLKIVACVLAVAPLRVWASPTPSSLICGGVVEQRLWRLWDSGARQAVRIQLVEHRLLRVGDTYALYDLQAILGNMVAMADRCRRSERLAQLADLLLPVFGNLEALPPPHDYQQGWICRGGAFCTSANRRLGIEVPLVSLQGLGLFTDLAARLHAQPDLTLQRHPFVRLSASVAQSHLERMATPALRVSLQNRLQAKSEDVKSTSSELLLTSFDLWRYTVALNTAALSSNSWRPSEDLRAVVQKTARLFAQRTFLDRRTTPARASLDAGFWKFHPDNAYAAYQGSLSPVECINVAGRFWPVSRNPPIPPQPITTLGWDISHARRLVPLFDAVNHHGFRAAQRYGLAPEILPSIHIQVAYANGLVGATWNQDIRHPLFSNFWGGANGWYRVAYDPGNQDCRLGTAPYGLSSAFAEGGFIAWSYMQPMLGQLGRILYRLSISSDPMDHVWLARYYPSLAVSDDAFGARQFGKLQFLAALISAGK